MQISLSLFCFALSILPEMSFATNKEHAHKLARLFSLLAACVNQFTRLQQIFSPIFLPQNKGERGKGGRGKLVGTIHALHFIPLPTSAVQL